MLHNQQSESIMWTWMNSACIGCTEGSDWHYRTSHMYFLCDKLEESCGNALSQRNGVSIMSEQKQLKRKMKRAQVKERARIYNIHRQRCFSSNSVALLWQSPSFHGFSWHVLTACLPIFPIPNEPVTQSITGPGSLLAWHPSRNLKCQLYSGVEGEVALHRNISVGKD